jgi:hypothetical protein
MYASGYCNLDYLVFLLETEQIVVLPQWEIRLQFMER